VFTCTVSLSLQFHKYRRKVVTLVIHFTVSKWPYSVVLYRSPTQTFYLYLWSPYGIGQSIIFSCCGFFLSIYLSIFFFPRLISAPAPYFYTWCGLSVNLKCRSEMCCTWLAENTGRKKVAKNRHLGTIAQLCWAISLQVRHVSTIGKKNLLSSNMSSRCSHNMMNFGTLAAKISPVVWGTQLISTAFASRQRYCVAVK